MVGGFFYFKSNLSDKDDELKKLKLKNQKEIRLKTQSSLDKLSDTVGYYKKQFKILQDEANDIQYVPYTQYIYVDMRYDDAYNVLSSTTYEKGYRPNNDTIKR